VLPGLICNLLNIFCFSNSFQKCALQLLGFQAPQAQMGEGTGDKPAPKPYLDWWGCVYKILLRSVQGFGFPSALHIPTDRQTNKQTSVRPFLSIYKRR